MMSATLAPDTVKLTTGEIDLIAGLLIHDARRVTSERIVRS